jgi:hypothetical protein
VASNRKGETMAGMAVICGMAAGFASFIVAVFSFFNFDWLGTGVSLAAAGLSFGLVANASLRH